MSTAQLDKPAPKQATIRDFLTGSAFKEQIRLSLPSHLPPDRFIRIALTAMTRTPELAECDQASFFRCLLDLSALGLEPDGRRAHLIPYPNNKRNVTECQLIVDWKGLVELAKRSGDVKSWRAEKVCEADEFSWEDGVVHHKIDFRKDRGAAECYYSAVTLADGTTDFEPMTKAEVEAIRRRSRAAGAGPWVTDFDEMAKKTVMRRHSKRLTLSPEFRDALERDDDRREELAAIGRVVPAAAPALFAPAPQPLPAVDTAEPTLSPRAEAPGASSEALGGDQSQAEKPKRGRKASAPPADLVPFELDDKPERATERLERKLTEAAIDRFKFGEWCDGQGLDTTALLEHEAEAALQAWDSIVEGCK